MKNSSTLLLLILLSFTSSSFSQVLNTKHLEEPPLKEGQCHTLVTGKIYLKDVTEKMRTDLGLERAAKLSNTDSESYYFCRIKCVLKSENRFLWITQKDRNENFKNMNGFVCPGLEIQDVALTPTLTIKTTVATPYPAVQTRYPEVHDYLKSISYKVDGTQAALLVMEFYNTLKTTIYAYLMANSPPFQEAATLLKQFSPENPNSWELAKLKVKQLEINNVQLKGSLLEYTKGEDLVNLFFLTNGRFLPYLN